MTDLAADAGGASAEGGKPGSNCSAGTGTGGVPTAPLVLLLGLVTAVLARRTRLSGRSTSLTA